MTEHHTRTIAGVLDIMLQKGCWKNLRGWQRRHTDPKVESFKQIVCIELCLLEFDPSAGPLTRLLSLGKLLYFLKSRFFEVTWGYKSSLRGLLYRSTELGACHRVFSVWYVCLIKIDDR